MSQQKLTERARIGAKVGKRHDAAATPLERTIRSGVLTAGRRAALVRQRNRLHPGELQREITRLCTELQRLASTKQPMPIRRVNRAVNASSHPELFREETTHRSRRS